MNTNQDTAMENYVETLMNDPRHLLMMVFQSAFGPLAAAEKAYPALLARTRPVLEKLLEEAEAKGFRHRKKLVIELKKGTDSHPARQARFFIELFEYIDPMPVLEHLGLIRRVSDAPATLQ